MTADGAGGATPSGSGGSGSPVAPGSRGASRTGLIAVALALILIIAGGLAYYYVIHRPSSPGGGTAPQSAGYAGGQLVTFVYNGSANYQCVPSIVTLYPGNATAAAAAATTPCEIGAADQSAVAGQVPDYLLIPAFAGLSIFGVASLGASAHGFPQLNGSPLLTQCGGGSASTACVDHPATLYGPLFSAIESRASLTTVAGLPLGVLPMPAHDELLDTGSTVANIPWGITVAFVLDPNIFPGQSNASCRLVTPSNLSDPTGNCLTSFTALQHALSGCSSSAANFDTKNPIWSAIVGLNVSGCAQVYVPGGSLAELNGNLYMPFAVQPGAPASLPS